VSQKLVSITYGLDADSFALSAIEVICATSQLFIVYVFARNITKIYRWITLHLNVTSQWSFWPAILDSRYSQYEGRSIKKLQNGIILLAFRILKKSEIYIL